MRRFNSWRRALTATRRAIARAPPRATAYYHAPPRATTRHLAPPCLAPRCRRPPQVFTFTDLNIYLADNPHYEALLRRLGRTCPKRMGCLFDFMISPGEGPVSPTPAPKGCQPSPRDA